MNQRRVPGTILCPPDPLCRWLGSRWETMAELAIALEREVAIVQDDAVVLIAEQREHTRRQDLKVHRESIAETRKIQRMMRIVSRRKDWAA